MIGIIAAMVIESKGILSAMENKEEKVVSGITFTKGILSGRDVVIGVAGMGKVSAALCAEAMIIAFSPERVINCGVGGGLAEDLHVGHAILATAAVQHDMDTSAIGDEKGFISGINIIDLPCTAPDIGEVLDKEGNTIRIRKGRIASGDKFVVDIAEKKNIRDLFSADVCEMEGAAIAQVCYMNSIPCSIVRTISDSLEGDGVDYETFKHHGAEISCEIVKKLVTLF